MTDDPIKINSSLEQYITEREKALKDSFKIIQIENNKRPGIAVYHAAAEYQIKSFNRESLLGLAERIAELVKTVELQQLNKRMNPDVVEFYRDAVEETKRAVLSIISPLIKKQNEK